MYQSFYGLSSKPFQLNSDPEFYFGSKQHRRARAYLEYGVHRNEGFVVITGEVGAGKTTIVRGLLASLDASKLVAANLVTTQLDAEDTLKMVGAAFGVRVKDVSKADLLMALEAYLVTQASQGKRCLLIVDEAQNLTPRAVEELRMLSNFQYGQQALLQTFLVGQPEFRATLQSAAMQQLRQRVTATCHVGPMDAQETQGYIEHRLKCAGATDRPTFDAAAFEAIFVASGGIPRRINQICDRLLLSGYLGEKFDFVGADVDEVVREMGDEAVDPRGAALPQADSALTWQPGPMMSDPAQAVVRQIHSLSVEHYDGRLRRLEGSMLRQERISLEILAMLRKVVLNSSSESRP